MTDREEALTVQIKYKDISKAYAGSAEQVWLALHDFFSRLLPTFKIADRLLLKVNLQSLATDCEGAIAFSAEGLNLLISRSDLTDSETLALTLLAAYLGFQLGKLDSDALSREELQLKLGKSSKIVSTRLGELIKSEVVIKTSDDKYRVSTMGIIQMQKEMLPRIRAKARKVAPKT